MPYTAGPVVSPSTALGMGEHLISLLDTIIQNLPEKELRKIRAAMVESISLADLVLENLSVSSTFDMLTVNDVAPVTHGRGVYTSGGDIYSSGGDVYTSAGHANFRGPTNDIAAHMTLVPPPSPSSLVGVIVDEDALRSPKSTRNKTTSPRTPTAARDKNKATPVSTSAQPRNKKADSGKTDPDRPFNRSHRPHVGFPDYRFHPKFVAIGIPGAYSTPPIDPSKSAPSTYYVITKGLYVGIFCNWIQCGPWVKGITGSISLKVERWEEAMELYNECLSGDTCEVLS